ncbi:AraC family transcriptional regulator [Chitinophaga pendula]|uniref:helix-turn-helix domain-containing protein n=1 Tax=Chitinophaga TaxID=79328 RepID=UPI000BB04DF0|nr:MULTISPECIES: AraC family transcriptional regulator [Chitinophaga]ASZ11706.1 AraC family transcriptional regulator [Chitinophaga sp. MD30]UCJ05277.1 AraC family transcriptional regulator [Chitinophaga pendula]
MKSETPKVSKLDSISEVHRMLGLPGPVHPLISLILKDHIDMGRLPSSYVSGFYKISFITKLSGKFRYGQGFYDFDEGSLLFTAPNQIIGNVDSYTNNAGYSLLIHPDFLQGYPLARKIKNYGFFSYATNEALHLSEQEKITMLSIYNIIHEELKNRIDDFSHEVIIAQIELLLSYAKRFYKRQFLTRQAVTSDLLQKLEELLNKYFEEGKPVSHGIPTVQYLADQLNYSPNYLSDMLRSLSGLNAQQHIHQQLIERSKELLSTTELTISEVAYELGFEHPQSFSRLFKMKTRISPVQFRSAFN